MPLKICVCMYFLQLMDKLTRISLEGSYGYKAMKFSSKSYVVTLRGNAVKNTNLSEEKADSTGRDRASSARSSVVDG